MNRVFPRSLRPWFAPLIGAFALIACSYAQPNSTPPNFSGIGSPGDTTTSRVGGADSGAFSLGGSKKNDSTGGGGGSGSCVVDYTISNSWGGGFGAALTIKNTGTSALSSWTLTWSFANGQTITQFWNGTETQSGSNVTVKNLSYNGSIPAGGTVTGLGFNGTWNNSTNAIPTAISLNGTACTIN